LNEDFYGEPENGENPGGRIPKGYDLLKTKMEMVAIFRCPRCLNEIKDHKQVCSCGRIWWAGLTGFNVIMPIQHHPEYKDTYKCEECGKYLNAKKLDEHSLQTGHRQFSEIYEGEDWNIHFEIREKWNYGNLGNNEFYFNTRQNQDEVKSFITDWIDAWKENIEDAGDTLKGVETDHETYAKVTTIIEGHTVRFKLKVVRKLGQRESVTNIEMNSWDEVV